MTRATLRYAVPRARSLTLVTLPPRLFVARLAGLPVFDPLGDEVGRVRDVVLTLASTSVSDGRAAKHRAVGLVVEVAGRRRVFVPSTRVTAVDVGQVITTGVVNLRRFEQHSGETLALADLLGRRIIAHTAEGPVEAQIEDLALDLRRKHWLLSKVFCREVATTPAGPLGLRLSRRRGETHLLDIEQVSGLQSVVTAQDAGLLVQVYAGMRPADLAEALHDLAPERRLAVAAALDDDRLADLLEQLPEDEQVEIIGELDAERAADVLEIMQPDDAADLLGELSSERQEALLGRMEPDDAAPVRRLLAYPEDSAGGLMTSAPIILGPEASIAEALALVRREEVPTTLATTVFVCRPPRETPTGTYLGLVHIQRLLRGPLHASVGSVLDKVNPLAPTAPLGQVHRRLAAYDLVAVPVVDQHGHLVGAVTVDDVLDHILPEDWRERPRAAGKGASA